MTALDPLRRDGEMSTSFGSLKARSRRKGPLFGYMVTTPSTRVVRTLADVGADFVVIDTEHQPVGRSMVDDLILATAGTGCSPTVRLPGADEFHAKPALDAGATAVWIPRVDSVEQAKTAVQISRYPPFGRRGVGPSGALRRWGVSRDEYLAVANDTVLVFAIIESITGVEALPEIARVPGIDVISIGRGDLSASLGHMGEENHPAVVECVRRIEGVARDAGLAMGEMARSPAEARDLVSRGYEFVVLGTDLTLMAGAARTGLRDAVADGAPA